MRRTLAVALALSGSGLVMWACATAATPVDPGSDAPEASTAEASSDAGCPQYNLDSDPKHCGACTTACTSAQVCSSGVCKAACDAPLFKCVSDAGFACDDLTKDPLNCGGCNNKCPVQDAGVLPTDNGNDSGIPVGDAGWDSGIAPQASTPTCVASKCGVGCPGSLTACADGVCYDTTANHDHCGGCGTACAADTEWCTAGHCCPQGQEYCNGACTDVLGDAKNCGGCGVVCPVNAPSCGSGVCSSSVHNTVAWSGFSTASNACNMTQNGVDIGNFQWLNLGAKTWKACMLEASKRNAMVSSPSYAPMPHPGWFSIRQPSGFSPNLAMTGQWANYITADISTSQQCTLLHEPQAVALNQYATKNLSKTTSYDGNTWHYDDFGVMYVDQCELLAGQYGGSVVTPWTIGLGNGDNYWQGILHTCSVYSWSSTNGTNFAYDNTVARASQKGCMIAYMDN